MCRLHTKSGDARTEPRDRVRPVCRVVNRRGAAGGDEETKLVKRDVVKEREEDLAERSVGERVPDLAPGTGRRAERHLASRPPHRGRTWSAGSFHRLLSM